MTRVIRPHRWANPFKLPKDASRSLRMESIRRHREWLLCQLQHGPLDLATLRGNRLGCSCPLELECHADMLADLAEMDSTALEELAWARPRDYPPMTVRQVTRHTIPELITRIGEDKPDWPFV